MEALVDKAWACFNKLTDKNPPDKPKKPPKSSLQTRHSFSSWMCKPDDKFDSSSYSGYPGSEFGGLMPLDPSKLPEPEELERAFSQLLEELDLPEEKQKKLCEQSSQKKWLMVVEQSNRRDRSMNKQSYVSIIAQLKKFNGEFPEKSEWSRFAENLEVLSISLRTESFSFVQEFIDTGGIETLVTLLNGARHFSVTKIAIPILQAFRAVLNSTTARTIVLENKEVLLSITASIDIPSFRTKVLTLEILAGLCLFSADGHHAVLEALTDAKRILAERARFQRLIDDLHREHGSNQRDSERVRVALMSLVNALLKSGPAEHSLEFRTHLRCELLMLGIQEAIDYLRDTHGSILEDHFDLFEMMRQEDEQELASSIDSDASSPIEMESPIELVEALGRKLSKTTALPHLVSLLQHLLMVPGNERYLPLWKLFDIVLQQLSLQTSMGSIASESDPQFSIQPIKIDMDEVLSRLRSQQEYERLEKDYQQLQNELVNERKRVLELENRLADFQDGVSISGYSRISESSSNPSDPRQTPPPVATTSALPQVKPPSLPPPPPPPPPSLKGSVMNFNVGKTKNVPKPFQPLKKLNWKKLPSNKIPGTIWEKMDDEKLYKSIDLVHFGNSFAMGKNSDYGTISSATLRRLKEPTTVSVLDPKRAQNCTIMLSKLKLNNKEIKLAVLSMDEKGKIPKDTIEQMLKFIPTTDELFQITEVVEKHGTATVLALADRFFYEVGRIPRYEQRLRCLNAIRGFQERLDELMIFANAISKASTTVQSSKKLKQLFSLILALGNYLNHSTPNGNAEGFTINSLHLIPDVKNSLKPETNLFHYIVELIEQKFPDLSKLKKDLSPVYEAAKYTKDDLDTEMKAIEAVLNEITQELETHRKMPSATTSEPADPMTPEAAKMSKSDLNALKKADRFVEVVGNFLDGAKKQFAELQKAVSEMNRKFTGCVNFFADDADKASPDSFFGNFTRFLNNFAECQHYLWDQKEEEERLKRQTLAKKTVITRKTKRSGDSRNRGGGGDRKDFDKLVEAIQSGDFFSEELNRLRTSFRIPRKK